MSMLGWGLTVVVIGIISAWIAVHIVDGCFLAAENRRLRELIGKAHTACMRARDCDVAGLDILIEELEEEGLWAGRTQCGS